MHIAKWKNSISKAYILHDSKYMTFWKGHNTGDSKRLELERREGLNRQHTENEGSETVLYDTIMMGTCPPMFVQLVECITSRVNPKES